MSDARDSTTWWLETRDDSAQFRRWLLDQLRGERTASDRILALRDRFATEDPRAYKLLTVIAAQERAHAAWVEELLRGRGIDASPHNTNERYWPHALSAIEDLETGCAVGAHAEKMRLERIEAIVSDPEAPEDVRAVFAKILTQERFHARAFRSLTTNEAMSRTRDAHELGRAALGLHP